MRVYERRDAPDNPAKRVQVNNGKPTVASSRFWPAIWKRYWHSPSVALCRVPELEFAATLDLAGKRTLDHQGGDGFFAQTAWPGQAIAACCDYNKDSTATASGRNIYGRVDHCDVSGQLPYPGGSFDLVFNNSGLEHVENLDAALEQIAMVLAPGGTLAFNVLNHRYFQWWPLGAAELEEYKKKQPFHHALDLQEWERRLARVGIRIESSKGYFNQEASRTLALLDYKFSVLAPKGFGSEKGLYDSLSSLYWRYSPFWAGLYWRPKIESLRWDAGLDECAGYFIMARRD